MQFPCILKKCNENSDSRKNCKATEVSLFKGTLCNRNY